MGSQLPVASCGVAICGRFNAARTTLDACLTASGLSRARILKPTV